MDATPQTALPVHTVPRSLFVLSVFYGGMVCLAGLAVGGHRGLRCTRRLVGGAKGHRAIPQFSSCSLAHRSGKRVHPCQAHRRIAESPGETICRAHLPSDHGTLPIWRIRRYGMNQDSADFVLRCKYRP